MLSTMSSVALELNSSFYTTIIRNAALDGFSGKFFNVENRTKI